MWQGRFSHVKIAKDVSAESFLQLFGGDGFKFCLWILDRRVVDQNVEPLKLIDGLLDRLPAKLFVTYIAGDGQTFAAFLLDLTLGFSRILMFVQIHNGDIRAFFRKSNSHCAPNAAVA